jgi:hypothetical protein
MPSFNPKPLPIPSASDIARLWNFIDRRGQDECWPWKGARNRQGYGCFGLQGDNYQAHRVAYLVMTGKDPGSLALMHSCDNPPCCNAAHLAPGTDKENSCDATKKGLNKPPDPKFHTRGERHPLSTMTALQVLEIRERHAAGARACDLARAYETTPQNICIIVQRKNWTHI